MKKGVVTEKGIWNGRTFIQLSYPVTVEGEGQTGFWTSRSIPKATSLDVHHTTQEQDQKRGEKNNMATDTYILTLTLMKRYKTQYGEQKLICRCGKPIKPGQEVASHKTPRRYKGSSSRFFHKECFEKLYIDLGD